MKELLLILALALTSAEAAARPPYDAADEQEPTSIWDDPNESNPYFKKKNAKTGADIKRENSKERKYYKTTFKRRVYTGPTPAQAAEQAKAKSVENFKTHLPSGKYDVRFESYDYNADGDTLTFKKLVFKPRPDAPEAKIIPYYLSVDEARFTGFNIGEIYGTPQNEEGRIQLSKADIPVWSENAVKVGKVTIDDLTLQGKGLALMKDGQADFSQVSLAGFHSEKIINETILNNIVRSKIFSARRAVFNNARISAEALEAIKDQSLNGLSFASAVVNTHAYTTPQQVMAEMISYSARVLNPDLVKGARQEAAKPEKDQKPTMEQIRKNAAENNAAKAKLAKETKE